MYISADEAKGLLNSRSKLRGDVEQWWIKRKWRTAPLDGHSAPTAMMARQIATFRYEDGVFALLAEKAGLTPSWFSLATDRYDDRSPFKRSLLHPRFFTRAETGDRLREVPYSVGPEGEMTGRKSRMSDIRVKQDRWQDLPEICPLRAFHRKQLSLCYPQAVLGDNDAWLGRLGGSRKYYLPFLSLFVAHAVLFEDYDGGESQGAGLAAFRESHFQPALEEIFRVFGVEPLLVRLPWWEELSYFPAYASWRGHGVIPDRYL
jgi:hypothetical protein